MNNDYFRLAREGETPTHYGYQGKIITYSDFMENARANCGVPLVKLGWFPASEKPKEEGKYICIVEGMLFQYWEFKGNAWESPRNLIAWAYPPPYEPEKEPWEVAWEKGLKLIEVKMTDEGLVEFGKRNFKAGYEARERNEK